MKSGDLDKKNVIDFLAIAAEFCAFVENANVVSKKIFIEKSRKIIALLYLKTSLLPQSEMESDDFIERFVTEHDWNFIQNKISEKLGENESYFDIIEPQAYNTSNETINVSTSECFADIYQDLRDMLEVYRLAGEEEQNVALGICFQNFKSFWGVRALMLMNELHLIAYSDTDLDDTDGADFDTYDNDADSELEY